MTDDSPTESVLALAAKRVKKDDRGKIILRTFSEMLARADYLTDQQREWAEARWLFETVWMFWGAQRSQLLHAITTFVGVFASLAIPVTAGIATTNTSFGVWARPATLVIGLIGATAVALDRIMHNDARWRLYRSGYEDLAAAGWAYFSIADEYSKLNDDERFEKFFERVENVLAARGQRYMVDIATAGEPGIEKKP